MATLPVKFYRSDDTGAPTLSGTVSALINVLDGCLLTGYNTRAVTSITQTGGVATLTVAAGHGFVANQVIAVSGANEAAYNGDFLVTGTTSTTLTFNVAGNPSSPATGTISAKVSPSGWTKAYSGANKAAYQNADSGGTRYVLRIDDSGAQWGTPAAQVAAVSMYKAMTGIDIGTGVSPPAAVWTGNVLPWHKSNITNSTGQPWILVASAKAFYLFVWPGALSCCLHGFGDFTSNLPSDANNAFLLHGNYGTGSYAANSVAATGLNLYLNGVFSTSFTAQQAWAGMDYSGYNAGGVLALVGNRMFGGYGFGEAGLQFPNPLDNGFFYSPLVFVERLSSSGTAGVRCSAVPGLYSPQHANPFPGNGTASGIVPNYTVLTGFAPNGGNFVSIPISTGGAGGNFLVDLTNAWS
ncbi:MAG: hypothetical protein PHU14_03210 [Methylovulum sp.]|nr:hypothetical protein [Methylovulum sp.]